MMFVTRRERAAFFTVNLLRIKYPDLAKGCSAALSAEERDRYQEAAAVLRARNVLAGKRREWRRAEPPVVAPLAAFEAYLEERLAWARKERELQDYGRDSGGFFAAKGAWSYLLSVQNQLKGIECFLNHFRTRRELIDALLFVCKQEDAAEYGGYLNEFAKCRDWLVAARKRLPTDEEPDPGYDGPERQREELADVAADIRDIMSDGKPLKWQDVFLAELDALAAEMDHNPYRLGTVLLERIADSVLDLKAIMEEDTHRPSWWTSLDELEWRERYCARLFCDAHRHYVDVAPAEIEHPVTGKRMLYLRPFRGTFGGYCKGGYLDERPVLWREYVRVMQGAVAAGRAADDGPARVGWDEAVAYLERIGCEPPDLYMTFSKRWERRDRVPNIEAADVPEWVAENGGKRHGILLDVRGLLDAGEFGSSLHRKPAEGELAGLRAFLPAERLLTWIDWP